MQGKFLGDFRVSLEEVREGFSFAGLGTAGCPWLVSESRLPRSGGVGLPVDVRVGLEPLVSGPLLADINLGDPFMSSHIQLGLSR